MIPVLLLAAMPLPTPQDLIREGELLPVLELPEIDGSGLVDLASFRGRKLLLIEFASW